MPDICPIPSKLASPTLSLICPKPSGMDIRMPIVKTGKNWLRSCDLLEVTQIRFNFPMVY